MTKDEALAQYRAMLLIRRFEERCAQIYVEGKIGGFLHLYIGQEAVAVAAMSLLRPDDYFVTSYRDHGYALARGHRPAAPDGGAVRQGRRDQPRQGRQHALLRRPHGQLRRGRHRGRAPAGGRRHGLRDPPAPDRAGRALLLRRRRGQRGRVPRGAQRQLAVEPPGRLRHREQPLRDGHVARPRLLREGPVPARQRLRHPPPRRGRDGPPHRDGRRWARRSTARARTSAPPSSRSRRTATAGTRCPTPASTAPRRRSRR